MAAHFELHRVTPTDWVILDESLSAHDPRRTVACVCETETDEYDVVWLRDVGLTGAFTSPEQVLDAVTAASGAQSRSRRPVHIPHVPPTDDRVSA